MTQKILSSAIAAFILLTAVSSAGLAGAVACPEGTVVDPATNTCVRDNAPAGGGDGDEAAKQPSGFENPIEPTTFFEFIDRIMNWVYVFSIPILSLLILYGAFLLVTSAGSEEEYSKAVKLIKYGIIGFIVISLSGAITYFIRAVILGL